MSHNYVKGTATNRIKHGELLIDIEIESINNESVESDLRKFYKKKIRKISRKKIQTFPYNYIHNKMTHKNFSKIPRLQLSFQKLWFIKMSPKNHFLEILFRCCLLWVNLFLGCPKISKDFLRLSKIFYDFQRFFRTTILSFNCSYKHQK